MHRLLGFSAGLGMGERRGIKAFVLRVLKTKKNKREKRERDRERERRGYKFYYILWKLRHITFPSVPARHTFFVVI